MKLNILITACLVAMLLFSCNVSKKEAVVVQKDTTDHGYNELKGNQDRILTVSDHNTDNPDIQIERPLTSTITTQLDTTLLFEMWTSDQEGPHADFVFSPKSFYLVDYDGDGDMPYELKGNHLKIYYNDFIQYGEILSVTGDSLAIRWRDADVAKYVKWK